MGRPHQAWANAESGTVPTGRELVSHLPLWSNVMTASADSAFVDQRQPLRTGPPRSARIGHPVCRVQLVRDETGSSGNQPILAPTPSGADGFSEGRA